MLPLRIFVSSPGDVAAERAAVRRVIDELEGSHLLRDKVNFQLVAWDDPYAASPMDARVTPQDSVNRYSGRPSDCDLTLVILWSRIGTVLPPDILRADGSRYGSGTVWEFEDASSAQRPVGLYRRTSKPQIDIDDADFGAKRNQYAAVNSFFPSSLPPGQPKADTGRVCRARESAPRGDPAVPHLTTSRRNHERATRPHSLLYPKPSPRQMALARTS